MGIAGKLYPPTDSLLLAILTFLRIFFIFIEIIKHFENELYNFIKNNLYEFIEDKNENGTTPVDKRIVELNKFANDNGYTIYNKNSRYFENDNAKFIDEKLANIKQKVIDKENFETIIIILNYLFNYKITGSNRVGFPNTALNKVLNTLLYIIYYH